MIHVMSNTQQAWRRAEAELRAESVSKDKVISDLNLRVQNVEAEANAKDKAISDLSRSCRSSENAAVKQAKDIESLAERLAEQSSLQVNRSAIKAEHFEHQLQRQLEEKNKRDSKELDVTVNRMEQAFRQQSVDAQAQANAAMASASEVRSLKNDITNLGKMIETLMAHNHQLWANSEP